MVAATLRFEVTWTFPYPVTTSGNGTALTICQKNGDPYLAFLTQTSWDDEVVYLFTFDGSEDSRHATPAGHEVINGMAYDPFRQVIWCSQGTSNMDTIIAFDPETGLETNALTTPVSAGMPTPKGLACNGFFFVRGGGPAAELWATNGFLLGTRNYTGRGIAGLSASPWSYTFVDEYTDEIVVIGPLGNEIAASTGIGAAGGMAALAFDYINHWSMDNMPQVWLPGGVIGAPGTINHPDTPWDPVPWGGRHRLYVANETDQTIYAGYLTAQ